MNSIHYEHSLASPRVSDGNSKSTMAETTQEVSVDTGFDASSSRLENMNGNTATKVPRDLKTNGAAGVVGHAANHIAGGATDGAAENESASARLDDLRKQENVSTGTYVLVMSVC